MNDTKSNLVERTLAIPDLHQHWIDSYYTEDDTFYELAFDYITNILKAPENSVLLDAGCGNCAHSIRLANRGFFVKAIDFSEAVLEMARENISTKGLEGKINIQRANILALPFQDKTFRYILCWGVLMHIPDLEKAITELTRVLKPGGILVISEGNIYSIQSMILLILKRFLGKKKADVKKTPSGIESWGTTSAGPLLTRTANIRWLIKQFKSRGFTVKKRIANQLTDAYSRVPSRLLRNLIRSFNKFWFRYIKIPYAAGGNILILQLEKVE